MTRPPGEISAGTQYAAVSALKSQVVPPCSRDASVELASVEVLPKKSWRWDAPGWLGNTIGSLGASFENRHIVWNEGDALASWAGIATSISAKVASASADRLSRRPTAGSVVPSASRSRVLDLNKLTPLLLDDCGRQPARCRSA